MTQPSANELSHRGESSDEDLRPRLVTLLPDVREVTLKIDKTRFFAIAGVLAAASGIGTISACTLTTVTSVGDRDGDGIKDDIDKCPDEREDFDGFEDEDGCPESGNGSTTDPDATPGSDATADAIARPDATAADASTCLSDDKVLNPSCGSFVDAGVSCAGSQQGQASCPAIQQNYVNGVSRAIMQCLSLAPSCEAVPDPTETCMFAALDKACPDATTAAPCQMAAQQCSTAGVTPTINQAKCQQYLGGLSAAGRAKFASCATEGCTLTSDAFCFRF